MDYSLLFGSIGIEFAANIVQPTQDVVGLPILCALKKVMFDKVCQSLLMF